ncbi:MAG TPA: alpha/beta fold hydrolase [Solirubrobacteraceae bacterium]|nr:alpha/beta fold hydrolase [Solirubrobacteraceae bacterium]
MTGVVEGAGVALAYEQIGPPDGPAVVLVHDMAADARVWAPVAGRLEGRVIAYDRRGYGGSGAPEAYSTTTVSEQAEDLAALMVRLDTAPALLAGEGFGALVVLDVLCRHRDAVRGAVLVDPPLFAFVPEATEELSARRAEIEGAVRAGGPGEAVARWLGAAAEPTRIARARGNARAFFADVSGLATLSLTRAGLRAIGAPVIVLTGPATAPSVRMAADRVTGLLPAAARADDGDVAAALGALAVR